MDMSRQKVIDDMSCIGNSMYLSFESDSTISNTAYRTMEGFEDLSTMSVQDVNNLSTMSVQDVQAVSIEHNQDSTLEAINISGLQETVKKVEKRLPLEVVNAGVAPNIPKNIFQDYKAFSSTPTHGHLWQDSVDKACKVPSERCADIQISKTGSHKKSLEESEENKENIRSEETGVPILSFIEENVIKKIETKKEESDTNKNLETINESKTEINIQKVTAVSLERSSDLQEVESKNNKSSLVVDSNIQLEMVSNAESNTETNTLTNPDIIENEMKEIPEVLDKVLQLSNKLLGKSTKDITAPGKEIEKRNLTKTQIKSNRNSLLPQPEKRNYNFMHRMSVIVKTTLNSPARKIPRKSLANPPGQNLLTGRKNIPINNSVTSCKAARRSVASTAPSRRSMLPVSTGTNLPSSLKLEKVVKDSTNTVQYQGDSVNEAKSKTDTKLSSSVQPAQSQSQSVATRSRLGSTTKKDTTFRCDICSRTFIVKSLLDAHKYSHGDSSPPAPSILKKASSMDIRAIPQLPRTANTSNPQCKYCDKKFAIIRALNIHLLEKCPKIPPNEKKKLQLTDLNHVEKAQLPDVFSHSSTKSLSKYSRQSESLSKLNGWQMEKKEVSNEMNSATEDNQGQMTKPLASVKKRTPHSGVYRTPSKSVMCHLCKQSFKSILDYTDHCLTLHSSRPNNGNGQPKGNEYEKKLSLLD